MIHVIPAIIRQATFGALRPDRDGMTGGVGDAVEPQVGFQITEDARVGFNAENIPFRAHGSGCFQGYGTDVCSDIDQGFTGVE